MGVSEDGEGVQGGCYPTCPVTDDILAGSRRLLFDLLLLQVGLLLLCPHRCLGGTNLQYEVMYWKLLLLLHARWITIIMIGMYGLVAGAFDCLRGHLKETRWNPKPHHSSDLILPPLL